MLTGLTERTLLLLMGLLRRALLEQFIQANITTTERFT